MLGTVIETNSRSALLDVAGVSGPVVAPFSEVQNAVPKVLDVAEIVSCTLRRGNAGDLYAEEIEILAGKREHDALLKMRPFAPWAKNVGEKYARGRR